MPNTKKLEDFVSQVRRDILRQVHKVNSGHPGGSLGCAEFFTVLYQEVMDRKDSFEITPLSGAEYLLNKSSAVFLSKYIFLYFNFLTYLPVFSFSLVLYPLEFFSYPQE